jgi:hypothetical protein
LTPGWAGVVTDVPGGPEDSINADASKPTRFF